MITHEQEQRPLTKKNMRKDTPVSSRMKKPV